VVLFIEIDAASEPKKRIRVHPTHLRTIQASIAGRAESASLPGQSVPQRKGCNIPAWPAGQPSPDGLEEGNNPGPPLWNKYIPQGL